MPPQKRIALIMGGGVSLGSFSGGALLQILRLLPHVDGAEAKIDVVTGASAGSMTLGIVAYHLFRGSGLDEIERDLHHAWVRAVSTDGLVPPRRPAHESPSLFSDREIRRVAARIMDFRRPPESQPHELFGDELLASFALTNLNGVAVRAEGQMIRQSKAGGGPVTGQGSVFADALQTTFHQDAMRFVIRRGAAAADGQPTFEGGARLLSEWGTEDEPRGWDDFRQAAIASGAFPGAFPPVQLRRHRAEFGRFWPDTFEADDPHEAIEEFPFDYVDGGVLRNEPLREAIELASIRDRGVEEEVDRVFIFVDPNVSGTTEAYSLPFNQAIALRKSNGRFDLETPQYVPRLAAVLGRFGGMLASQAAFRDWLKAARVNSQVEWRDRLLEEFILHLPEPAADLEERLGNVIDEAYRDRARRALGGDADEAALSQDQIDRARRQRERDLERRLAETNGHRFAAQVLLLVDLIGNLREKRKLNMVAVTPNSAEEPLLLAGSFLGNFGGFFEERYRQHDFDVGRYVAARVLTAPIPNGQPEAAKNARTFLREDLPVGLVPRRPDPIDPRPYYGGLEEQRQKAFEEMLRRHISNAVRSNRVVRWIAGWYGGRKMRASLRARREGRSAHLLVRIEDVPRGAGLEGFAGRNLRAADSSLIQTVIGLHVHPGGAADVFGPHVTNGPLTEAIMRYRPERWRRASTEIRFSGSGGEWLRAIQRCSRPQIVLNTADIADGAVLDPTLVRDATASAAPAAVVATHEA